MWLCDLLTLLLYYCVTVWLWHLLTLWLCYCVTLSLTDFVTWWLSGWGTVWQCGSFPVWLVGVCIALFTIVSFLIKRITGASDGGDQHAPGSLYRGGQFEIKRTKKKLSSHLLRGSLLPNCRSSVFIALLRAPDLLLPFFSPLIFMETFRKRGKIIRVCYIAQQKL